MFFFNMDENLYAEDSQLEKVDNPMEVEELSEESDADEVAAPDPIINYDKAITLTKQLKTFV